MTLWVRYWRQTHNARRPVLSSKNSRKKPPFRPRVSRWVAGRPRRR